MDCRVCTAAGLIPCHRPPPQEIRLELDDSKLKGIITELDILHRATGPEIVEFYGAFFIESCVYYWCVRGPFRLSAMPEGTKLIEPG